MSETQSEVTTEEVVATAKEFLGGVLERMGIDADISIHEEEDKIVLEVDCDDVDRIIGKRGQVIDALQHLVSKVSYRNRPPGRGKPVLVDAGDYRAKHIERLEALAGRMGEKVKRTGEVVELNPMSAHDRRVVHMALADVAGVSTRSEGEGEDRHVLVVPSEDEGAAEASAE